MEGDHFTREELALWLDGEMDRVTGERVRQHVMRCPVCRAEVEMLRRLSVLLSSAGLPERLEAGEEELWRKLASRIARTRSERDWLVPLLSVFLYFSWQAASMIFIAVGLASFLGMPVPYSWVLDAVTDAFQAFGLAWVVGLPGGMLDLVGGSGSPWLEWGVSAFLWGSFLAGIAALYGGWLASQWRGGCPMKKLAGRREDIFVSQTQ